MATLRLMSRQSFGDDIENWDDDDFLIDNDDFAVQSQSNSGLLPSHRRDSHSSLRSDFESVHGEEEKQVHLPGDDEKSTLDAIAAAAKAGIPISRNVPLSALVGGTIKRLGGGRIKKIPEEDWVDDMEFPDPGETLRIKPQDASNFPAVLRHVSNSAHPSPTKLPRSPPSGVASQEVPDFKPQLLAAVDMVRFRDNRDDDDLFAGRGSTIKVSKRRTAVKPMTTLCLPSLIPACKAEEDNFEQDLELPSDGKLALTNRRDIPKTPSSNLDDLEWAEGSLGTRFGGTRRDRSTRSSSASALSPSLSSSITGESEDEVFDGLILPTGPLNFEARLRQRQKSRSPERIVEETAEQLMSECGKPPGWVSPTRSDRLLLKADEKEDLLSGIELGDGDVLESKKLTLHRNVQVKHCRSDSPSRPKTSVTLKFTNKSSAPASRLPRPMASLASHERTHQSLLEPVLETGGPVMNARRSLSRLGHSHQSSVSSYGTPSAPVSTQAAFLPTPRRREMGQTTASVPPRDEPTTTSAQLLRLKRSLPAMRAAQSPARPFPSRGSERPTSRTDTSPCSPFAIRPKTPVDRARNREAAGGRKGPTSFMAGGMVASQPYSGSARGPRVFRRIDSDTSLELRANSRAVSRSALRSPSPRKHRAGENVASEGAWHQVSRPRRVRYFGDGHELDEFDDLATSAQAEAKFIRQPCNPNKGTVRNKMYQHVLPERTVTPSPIQVCSPARLDHVPGFARDTAASRIAREANLAQRTSGSAPLVPLTAQRVAQLSARNSLHPHMHSSAVKGKKARRPPQLKPHLISNLNPPKESKMVNGMFYNPITYRWEGNDNALREFEGPASTPSTTSMPLHVRERDVGTPRPALITNIGATKGVQVVGGMVFDPQNMCWLKMGSQAGAPENYMMDAFDSIEEEDDIFKDIPDLEDATLHSSEGCNGPASDIKDDWLVGEEFDVGPEFIRRQREEEERWRKKCGAWVDNGRRYRDRSWRFSIRKIVNMSTYD